MTLGHGEILHDINIGNDGVLGMLGALLHNSSIGRRLNVGADPVSAKALMYHQIMLPRGFQRRL